MNHDELDTLLAGLSSQDVDRFRAERTRALAHQDLRSAANLRQRKMRAFEPMLVAAACVVYLSWALLEAMTALGG